MRVVTTLPPDIRLHDVPSAAQRCEDLGFDTVHVPETVHDSLTVALLALEHTSKLRVRTSMTLAFPRSPMITAYSAWDLARFSAGRFSLGLATQVRGNIVGRFSMPWTQPAEQLADYIKALRAIFAAFAEGTTLLYEGSHYRFDRLQPYFNPGPLDVDPPALFVGGVNRRMCELGGALADGFVTHPTNSHPAFLRESVIPALEAGAAAAGRNARPTLVVGARAIAAPDPAALTEALAAARKEMAFLYSTPAYRPTLTLLGYDALGEELTTLVRQQRWDQLPTVLPDEVLNDILPLGTYAELPAVLASWYGGLCEELTIQMPTASSTDRQLTDMLDAIREI